MPRKQYFKGEHKGKPSLPGSGRPPKDLTGLAEMQAESRKNRASAVTATDRHRTEKADKEEEEEEEGEEEGEDA